MSLIAVIQTPRMWLDCRRVKSTSCKQEHAWINSLSLHDSRLPLARKAQGKRGSIMAETLFPCNIPRTLLN